MLEKWFAHKIEMRANDVSNALAIQKELAIKKAEFESVKLNKALPLLESMNGLIYRHNMIFSEYIRAILNNTKVHHDIEHMRFNIDKEMIKVLSAISIYVAPEFRAMILTLRKITSCSFRDPQSVYSCIKSIGPVKEQIDSINECYLNATNCFYEMCAKYIGTNDTKLTYSEILTKHKFNQNGMPDMSTELQNLSWKFVLLNEYFGSSEQVDAQNKLESHFKLEAAATDIQQQ